MKIFDISDPANPRVRRRRRDRLRLAHPHAGARAGAARTSTSTSPRTRPARRSRTASRRTTGSRRQGAGRKAPSRPRSSPTPVLFPDGGNPAATTRGDHDAAATTSPPTRRRTSPPAPAWVTASCSTSPTGTRPVVIDRVAGHVNFAFWHSATFNNDGNKVVFTDELGGGGAADLQRGRSAPTRGANGIYDIVGEGKPRSSASYYKIPRPAGRHRELRRPQRLADPGQGPRHHGPGLVPGRHLGLRLHRLRASPKEIGYFERGPLASRPARPRRLVVGVLLQRLHLLQRHPEGPRRAEDRRPVARGCRRTTATASSTRRASPASTADLTTPTGSGPAAAGPEPGSSGARVTRVGSGP